MPWQFFASAVAQGITAESRDPTEGSILSPQAAYEFGEGMYRGLVAGHESGWTETQSGRGSWYNADGSFATDASGRRWDDIFYESDHYYGRWLREGGIANESRSAYANAFGVIPDPIRGLTTTAAFPTGASAQTPIIAGSRADPFGFVTPPRSPTVARLLGRISAASLPARIQRSRGHRIDAGLRG